MILIGELSEIGMALAQQDCTWQGMARSSSKPEMAAAAGHVDGMASGLVGGLFLGPPTGCEGSWVRALPKAAPNVFLKNGVRQFCEGLFEK